jgi:hypothetical protein
MDNSAELRDTIQEALKGAGEACKSLSGFILQAANHLRSGEIREGNQLLAEVLDDFSQIASLLDDAPRCAAFMKEGKQREIDDLERESREMADLLKMAVSAQESEDWVFLADVLEYEFAQKLGSWDVLLSGLSRPVEAPSSV